MTDAQKARQAANDASKEFRALALKEGSTSEDIEKATKELNDLETRAEALERVEPVVEVVKTEPTEDSETRERRELRSKARVSDFVVAALKGQPVTGASGEYADAEGLSGRMPLSLLERESEERAVTPGPDSGTVTTTRPTVPYAFSRTDSAALGITFPMVAPGEAHFPALETAPPAGPKAKDAAAAQTAAAFTLVKRDPKRITGQFLIRLEDLALLPSMETDLRRGITSAMADSLDAQVIGGSGAAPNLSGLFHQATDVAVDADTETFASAIERYAGVVDGKHANGFGDIYALIGVNTFAKYAAIFANADKGDLSAYDVLKSKLGMLRVSTRVPAVAASGQKGIAVLSAQGQAIAVPTWSGVELIVDPYSQVAKGQRVVTAVTLVGSPFVPFGDAQVIEIHPKLS